MKPELEAKLEDRCVAKAEARDGVALKLLLRGLRGFPDRTVMLPGRIIFFCEFKRQKLGRFSVQQATWRRILTILGFGVYTIDTDAQFDAALERETTR